MRALEPKRGDRPSRRELLRALPALALLAAAGGVAIGRAGGYRLPSGRSPVWMSAWQWSVVEHAARRIAAPDHGGGAPAPPSADEVDVTGFVDAWVSKMPAKVRRDLARFLAYVEHVAPLAAGHASRFTRLDPLAQDRVLGSLEASRQDLLRAGFDGLKSLVFVGYYRDPRTWSVVGYDGPLVGRPPGGWR